MRPRVLLAIQVAGVAAGLLLAGWDFVSGPSLNLWAVNATVLIILTIEVLLLLARSRTLPPLSPASGPWHSAISTPTRRMHALLRGADEGFTQNRKEVAQLLRSAVAAKLATPKGPAPKDAVDARILGVLGPKLFSELLPDDSSRPAKVRRTPGYILGLNEGLSLLQRALGV
jgi:hypothetical protein